MALGNVRYKNWSMDNSLVYVDGTFRINSAAVSEQASTPGVAVTYNSAGNYTLTIEAGVKLISARTDLNEAGTSSGLFSKTGPVDATVATTATVIVYVVDSTGTETDPADDSNVSYQLTVKNSSVGRQ